jgi:tetratricopeptide (TPR) repeat protein
MTEIKKDINPLLAVEILINGGKLLEAEKLITKINTDETTRLTLFGLVEFKKKNSKKAYQLLAKAVEISPNNKLAQGYLSTILVNEKKYKEAERHVEIALEKYPNDHQFIINKILIMNENHKHEELIKYLKPKLELAKNSIFHTVLISALRSLYKIDEAIEYLAIAMEKYPLATDLIKVRADILSEIDPAKSYSAYEDIYIAGDPGKATRWNSSFVDLRKRNWQRGLESYEYGLEPEIGQIGRPLPEIMKLFKRIEKIEEIRKDDWIVICGEQGIGDQIFFLSCLKDIIKITKKIIILIDQRLISIVQRSFPETSVMKFGVAAIIANKENIRGYIPLGSLLKLTRKNDDDFIKNKDNYIKSDLIETNKFREIIKNKSPNKPIIGISWKGGFWERQQKGKTIEIEAWNELLKRNDMTFVNLQYGNTEKERKYCLENGFNVKFIKDIDYKKNLDGWLSIMNSCDMIISISTALVHFAAASGKKVYLLLSDKQQPFIWGLDETKSIVYKDVNIVRMSKDINPEQYFQELNKLFK